MNMNSRIVHQDRRFFNQRSELRAAAVAVLLLVLSAIAMTGGLVGAVLVEIVG
jgi:hypothetical protein